jgi:hypothetical protein
VLLLLVVARIIDLLCLLFLQWFSMPMSLLASDPFLNDIPWRKIVLVVIACNRRFFSSRIAAPVHQSHVQGLVHQMYKWHYGVPNGIMRDKHPGRSRPCVMRPWGDPKWYLHSRMRTVYMRSSIRGKKEKESEKEKKKKKNHRSMVPIGYYCADCKKFLTTEEYNQKSSERWEEWQAAHPAKEQQS